jgi:hypothetical protein
MENELILKLDKETTIPLIEGLGKSAYAIAVAHGFRGTEQEWLDSLKGLQGPQGEPGLKGDPFRYEDFTPEQLEALKGPKGDKGEDGLSAFNIAQLNGFQGTYVEWLKSLKGKDGASATADNAHQLLLQGNVWCESASVDDVLTALIGNMGKPFPRTEFKPLTIPSVIQGQQVVSVTGEPHYSVKVLGNDTPFTLDSTGTCSVNIPPLGEDDIKLTYHNFTGAKVGDYTIKGVQTGAAADDTLTDSGIKYELFGSTLKINATNYEDTDFSRYRGQGFTFIPSAWANKSISNIQIKSSVPVVLYCNQPVNNNNVSSQQIPIYVSNPQNISFKTNDLARYRTLNIGTLEQGLQQTTFNYTELIWSDTEHRYIGTGDPMDYV